MVLPDESTNAPQRGTSVGHAGVSLLVAWQEFCGTPHYPWWGRGYVVGIEPHSSIPGLGLQKAIERGTQLTLPASGSLSSRLSASLVMAEEEPKGVTEEGQLVYS